MFAWFFNWFRKDKDYFCPKKRCIYRYFDGQKTIIADPMILYRRLIEKSGDLSVDMQIASSMHNDRFKARVAMIDKIRWIFAVKSLEDGGLSESECENLLDHFVDWIDDLKKNLSPSATSQNATSQSSKPSLVEKSPTQNSSGSGSTVAEIFIEKPTPSH